MQTGHYRHYKGQDYLVLGVARHSETGEELVVYRQEYGDRSLWVRPRAMFEEMVEVDGEAVPRFRFLDADEPAATAAAAAPSDDQDASPPAEADITIKLDQFLKLTGIVGTGGQAKQLIRSGLVRVNGEVETRRGRQLRPGDEVDADGEVFSVELE